MIVQVSTDRNVDGRDALAGRVEDEVTSALARYSDQLTRVEVHLGDENAGRSGSADKRCTVEARPSGRRPVAVTHHAATLEEAYRGAIGKLRNVLESAFGRLSAVKGSDSIRDGQPADPVAPPAGDAPPTP
jgi:hypothetical protein